MVKLLQATIFYQTSGYMLQFGAIVVFARVLGSEGQGILAVFRSLGQILVSLIWFGIPSSIVFFIGKDKHYFKSLLKHCLEWFGIVFTVLVLVSFVLPIDRIPKVCVIEQHLSYLLAFVFLLALFNLFQGLMLSLKKYFYYNLFAFGLGFTIFIGSILTSFVSIDDNRLTMAIGAYLAGYMIMVVYGLSLTILEGRKLNRPSVDKLNFIDQFRVSLRGYISSLASLLLFRMDLFLVAYFLSFKEVGIYSIALFCAEMITKIPNWTASILTPMVASAEDGHVRRTIYLLYTSVIIAAILGIGMALIIKIFPTIISTILGRDFIGVEICLLFLLPRVLMQSGVGILAANLAGKGYPWYHPAGCTIPLIFLVLLDIILIPRLGINGAALGNSLAYVCAVLIFWIGFRKYNELNEDVRLKTYWRAMRGYLHG